MSKFICSIVNRSFSFLRHVFLQHTFFGLKVVFINFPHNVKIQRNYDTNNADVTYNTTPIDIYTY